MRQLLASIGIGAATVDTTLNSTTFYPGGLVTGEAIIRGGAVAQEIGQIYLYLRTSYSDEHRTHGHTLARYEVVAPFVIEAGQSVAVDISLRLPYATPLSIGHHPISLKTGLDISWALDPTDADTLQIEPTPLQQKMFETLRALGFQLHRVQNEYTPFAFGRPEFVQEFELRPIGAYKQQLQELELIFLPGPSELRVLLEVNRRVRGLGHLLDSLDLNERRVRLSFTDADLHTDWAPQVAGVLNGVIQGWAR